MIRSIWTEVSSFLGGLFLASIAPSMTYNGYGVSTHFLSTIVFVLLTYLLIYRMIRNKAVSLVLAGLGTAYWAGIIAAGLGFAYLVYVGVDEWSVGLWAYVLAGTAMAVLAYRGRAAFDQKAGDFPTI